MKSELKNDSHKRLARIAGQVTGIQKMVEGDRACGDILQQIVAVRAALDQLGIAFLSEHLQTCVLHQNVKDEEDCCTHLPEDQWSEEIKSTLKRYLK
jgi:CsoR family transcriptional regulator, copper-sensing transcriptional repressor